MLFLLKYIFLNVNIFRMPWESTTAVTAEEMAISIATATMQGAVIGQYVKCLVKNGYKFENASDQEVRSEKSPSCMEHQELVTED